MYLRPHLKNKHYRSYVAPHNWNTQLNNHNVCTNAQPGNQKNAQASVLFALADGSAQPHIQTDVCKMMIFLMFYRAKTA